MTDEMYEQLSAEFTDVNKAYNRLLRRGDAPQNEIDTAELALLRARKRLDAAYAELAASKAANNEKGT